jgi:plastocyanin
MRRFATLALTAGLLVAPTALSPARAQDAAVEVHSDYFKAARVSIEPGESVRWTAIDDRHTVSFDDGSLEFPSNAPTGGELNAGDQFVASFPTRGTYFYHCRIHGSAGEYPHGMTGVVYVGIKPDEPTGEVRHVPSEYGTIRAALSGIGPGSTVSLAPGIYEETVSLTVGDLTLQGEGAEPGEVVIQGDGTSSTVVTSADGPVIRNLSVVGADRADAIVVSQGNGFMVEDVVVDGGAAAVRIAGARAGAVRDVRTRRQSNLGVAVVGCSPCGVLIEDVDVLGTRVGLLVLGSSGVVARRLTSVDNDTGILVSNSQGVDVTAADITGGNVGIDVNGSVPPTLDVRVFNNRVTGYSSFGLRWDLVGLRTCFSGNVDDGAPDGIPASQPPMLQSLFACSTS